MPAMAVLGIAFVPPKAIRIANRLRYFRAASYERILAQVRLRTPTANEHVAKY
jgi:hypothetical protein